ncbi:uncharacterized protein LOC133524031 [Cydia pomonella]|uniref:uncharacterized protein LOC133524031 n=1 Tax=Cydia pomonella TaxID=82600 RepID=UPI002ADD4DEF|nr:uncharacterized protein LOC133524031 [Cydia pomonella]
MFTSIVVIFSVIATTTAIPLSPAINDDPLIFISNPIEAHFPSHWMPLSIVRTILNKPMRPRFLWTTRAAKHIELDEVISTKIIPTERPIGPKTAHKAKDTNGVKRSKIIPTEKSIKPKTPKNSHRYNTKDANKVTTTKIMPTHNAKEASAEVTNTKSATEITHNKIPAEPETTKPTEITNINPTEITNINPTEITNINPTEITNINPIEHTRPSKTAEPYENVSAGNGVNGR